MIKLGILLTCKDPGNHGSVFGIAPRNGRINGIIDQSGGIPHGLKTAEGKIVVPGDHLHLSVFFIKIIVVDHRSGVTVKIEYKIVHRKITDDLFDLHRIRKILTHGKFFKGADQPFLIRLGHLGLGAVKDVLITFHTVINVFQ